MTSIQSVVSSVRTVVIACKTIVAKKEQAENEALLNNFSRFFSSFLFYLSFLVNQK